jgi:hypothetical protein
MPFLRKYKNNCMILVQVKVSKIKVINVQAMCSLAVRIRKPKLLGPRSILTSI